MFNSSKWYIADLLPLSVLRLQVAVREMRGLGENSYTFFLFELLKDAQNTFFSNSLKIDYLHQFATNFDSK